MVQDIVDEAKEILVKAAALRIENQFLLSPGRKTLAVKFLLLPLAFFFHPGLASSFLAEAGPAGLFQIVSIGAGIVDEVAEGQDPDGQQIAGNPVEADPHGQDAGKKEGEGQEEEGHEGLSEAALPLLEDIVLVLVEGQGQG